MDIELNIVVEHKSLLGECPIWNAKRKVITWVDILNGNIHEYSTVQQTFRTIPVYQKIGSLAICQNARYVAALQHGFAFVNMFDGEIKMITDPENHLPNNRFNEGKCDPAGRFWAGTMSLSEDANAGSVYFLGSDLSVTKTIEKVSISNGMAWSMDHRVFYYIDTPTFDVVAFDYDVNTGDINNRRTVINIPEKDGYPDGMAIDAEGMLWIAHWDGWQITRWNPKNGEQLSNFALPVSKVTSCAFGGDNMDDLYITSAKVGLTDEELEQQPLAGSLFVIKNCGFKGIETFEFKFDQ